MDDFVYAVAISSLLANVKATFDERDVTHMGVCQQLLHDEIIVDLFGKYPPFFRAFQLLVHLDLQCINEKFLMESEMTMRATTLLQLK